MSANFTSFVILGEMRTGSNLLETNLNAIEGVTCYGEIFNPVFFADKDKTEFLDLTLAQRDADPQCVLDAIARTDTMVGFRLFHDHDPRVRAQVLADRTCAKIMLNRNPLDSYVSRKIAAVTDQWRLFNLSRQKRARAVFDGDEFAAHVALLQRTQLETLRILQESGQGAFHVNYEDVNDLDVLNGIAQFLGVPGRIAELPRKLKRQNPEPLDEKLENPEAVAPAVARIDWCDLGRAPWLEPRRGPMVPNYVAAARGPLLFMPVPGVAMRPVCDWLAELDGVGREGLLRGFTQASLRDWRKAHPGHRSFTLVTHPLLRAWRVYATHVRAGEWPAVRNQIERLFGFDLDLSATDPDEIREGFGHVLKFMAASLAGQTDVWTRPQWASQAAVVQGFGAVAYPDHVLREHTAGAELEWIATLVGCPAPDWREAPDPGPVPLISILDDTLQSLARTAYARDYETFGYQDLD
jgi:hypothetical protein